MCADFHHVMTCLETICFMLLENMISRKYKLRTNLWIDLICFQMIFKKVSKKFSLVRIHLFFRVCMCVSMSETGPGGDVCQKPPQLTLHCSSHSELFRNIVLLIFFYPDF